MEGRVTFERLNDFNWTSWKFRMELLLLEKEVWDVVSNPKGDKPAADWASKDAKARATIGLSLETNQLCHVQQAGTAYDMWLALKGHHQRNSLTNKVYVYRRLFSLRLSEGGDVSDHLNEISCLANNLCEMGEKVADHLLVAIMLSSLPASYSNLVTSIETRAEVDLKVEYVRGQLLDEWRRRREDTLVNLELDSALKVHVKKGSRSKVCHYCKMEGHFQRVCPKAAEDREEEQEESRSEAKKAVVREDNAFCFSAGVNKMGVFWCLDSGASAHMTSDINVFVSLTASSGVSVLLADGRKLSVEAVGKCEITTLDTHGEKRLITLDEVMYVPELASNLMSVGRLADENYDVLFGKKRCKVLHNGEVVLQGDRKDDVYWLKQQCCQSQLSIEPPIYDLTMKNYGDRSGYVEQLISRSLFGIKPTAAIFDLCVQMEVVVGDGRRDATFSMRIREYVNNNIGRVSQMWQIDGGGKHSIVGMIANLEEGRIFQQQPVSMNLIPVEIVKTANAKKLNKKVVCLIFCGLLEEELKSSKAVFEAGLELKHKVIVDKWESKALIQEERVAGQGAIEGSDGTKDKVTTPVGPKFWHSNVTTQQRKMDGDFWTKPLAGVTLDKIAGFFGILFPRSEMSH